MNEREKREQEFYKILEEFDGQTKKAFLSLLDYYVDIGSVDMSGIMRKKNGHLYIRSEQGNAYEVLLALKCAEDVCVEGDEEWGDLFLSKTDGKYVLEIVRYDEINQQDKTVRIPFTEAKTEITSLNYARSIGYSTERYGALWSGTAEALLALQKKADWDIAFFNDMEKRLLPLTQFSPILSFTGTFSEDTVCKSEDVVHKTENTACKPENNVMKSEDMAEEAYTRMTEYINDFGNEKLRVALDTWYYAKTAKERKKQEKVFMRELQQEEAFPLWKGLQSDIEKSCREYPLTSEIYIEPEYLKSTRKEITNAMHENGFFGEYPNFTGKITDGNRHFLISVECYEEGYFDELRILFLFGTKIENLKQIEKNEDARIVFFKGKGKRCLYEMEMNIASEPHSTRDETSYIHKFCQVLKKRVRGQKLTKDERKNPWYQATPVTYNATRSFIFGVIAFGILVSLLFTLGMAGISLVIVLAAILFFKRPLALLGKIFWDSIWLNVFAGGFVVVEMVILIVPLVTKWISKHKNKLEHDRK